MQNHSSIYLYEVKRGTEVWIWVVEPSAAVEFVVAFWILVKAGLHAIDKYIDFEKKRFELLNQKATLFEKIKESSHPNLMIDNIKAKTFIGRNKALRRLAEQNLKEIKLIDPKTGKSLAHLSDK